MDNKDKAIRRFFDGCINEWRKTHGREPETRDEMWDAVMDGVERQPGKSVARN